MTERMPDAAVYMVHGFGHRSPGLSRADGVGGDDGAVIDDYAADPISGSNGMRTAVRRRFSAAVEAGKVA